MSERLRHIVERMKIQPGDVVLEIGCGHGVAASYICERLRSGRLLAVDRSPLQALLALSGKLFIEYGKPAR